MTKKPAKRRSTTGGVKVVDTDALATNELLVPWVKRRYDINNQPLPLIREALLLNEGAYEVVVHDRAPMKRGFVILLIILGIVSLAQLIGLGLGLLTTPRVDVLSDAVLEQVVQFDWYLNSAAADPAFESTFSTGYTAAWQAFRIAFGLPSATGTVTGILSMIGSTLLGWLLFGIVAHWVARWFGGKATPYQFYGALGLSYAPLLLLTLELVPGFQIPWALMFLLLFITKYQAIKRTYDLGPGYSLATNIAPYVIMILFIITAVLFAAAIGLNQIPLLDQILRFLVL